MSIYQLYTEVLPPAPTFTEKDLPDLSAKVYIVTGGASGVGFELCKILYQYHAKIYIAGRSLSNATTAIETIRAAHPDSKGTLQFLQIDLSDLTTVKPAAEEFLRQESRLDVVWHNAGVMVPPNGSVDKQGHELQLGTNVIAPWLFQTFLTPILTKTAAMPETPKNSVRVIWVSSSANLGAPYPGGINWGDINFENTYTGVIGMLTVNGGLFKYGQSKAGNIILGAEAAKRWRGTGIVSLSLNPGNLKSNLDRTSPWLARAIFRKFITYPAYYGGLTELFAGLSPSITEEEHNGEYIIPWGRFGEPRADIKQGLEENGKKLWEYCEAECKDFM